MFIGSRNWSEVVADFVNHLLRTDYPKRVPLPNIVTDPSANVLLVRGVSWRDDDTFEKLEHHLTEYDSLIHPIRYSYKGYKKIYEPLDYSPLDTISDMIRLVNILDKYVRELLGMGLPLNIVAYSLGGLVTANWICRPDSTSDHYEIVRQVNTISLLGVPLYPPSPFIFVRHPALGQMIWAVDGERREFDRTSLLSLYPNVIVNVIGSRDTVAPKEYASLSSYTDLDSRLIEREVKATHRRVPQHTETIGLVISHIKRK